MLRMLTAVFACLAVVAGMLGHAQESGRTVPTMSINDLMVTVITPATDTIWGIEDPQGEPAWRVFIDAAETVIAAGEAIKLGGSGPNDRNWAADPDWQAFADQLIAAGQDAKRAAEASDLEAMYSAGEVLYPPCEECHIRFHPGVDPE